MSGLKAFFKKGTKLVIFSFYKAIQLLCSIFIEQYWLQTNYVPLSFNHLPDTFSGLSIIQFSDVHFGNFYSYKKFEQVVSRINELKPDLIFFTGDLYDATQGHTSEACIPLLSGLKARYGKWAVLGNHDYRSGSQNVVKLLKKSDFTVLRNENQILKCDDQHIRIVGLDDVILGKPDLHKALAGVQDQEFTMLLVHEPDYADIAADYPIDLQFSGHSHGGQIRLPFIGALKPTKKGRKYIQGLYKIKKSKLQLYTNRGIGMTFLPIRLFCRPEITVFTFHNNRHIPLTNE
jgi:predicted MPP superfamily phosphohydrolase